MSLETRGYIPPEEDLNQKLKKGAEEISALIAETLRENPDLNTKIRILENKDKMKLKKPNEVQEVFANQFLDSEEGTNEDTKIIKEQQEILKKLKPETLQKIKEKRERSKNRLTDEKLPHYYQEKAKKIIEQTKPEIEEFYSKQKNA